VAHDADSSGSADWPARALHDPIAALWQRLPRRGTGRDRRKIVTEMMGEDSCQLGAVRHRDLDMAFEAAGSAKLYSPSSRPYQGLPEVEYPFHDRDVLVTACGRICMHRKKINISTVMAGQRLGIKEVDEGIWLVSFMTYDLGYIDLEQRTLQTIDNPFGTRLSPMS